jgi:hypothetical protein
MPREIHMIINAKNSNSILRALAFFTRLSRLAMPSRRFGKGAETLTHAGAY